MYIPILTSPAGGVLTYDNWEAVGVSRVSIYLDSLLVRPGLQALQCMKSIADWLCWPHEVVLNASRLVLRETNDFVVRSPVDGHVISLTVATLLELLASLSPDFVVLPEGVGNTNFRLLTVADGVESDVPAIDASEGRIYTTNGAVDLTASGFARDFGLLDDACTCPTCQASLSRGYLHHLLQQTPLLAKRYLVQHNVAWVYCYPREFSI